MTEPSQYFKGRTVQEQMNEVIGYVDVRSAEVATDAIAADVAQVHQDMLDADADAAAAAASAAAAAGTLANAVKKTGEASQSIAGDIAVSGVLSGGSISAGAGGLGVGGHSALQDVTVSGNITVPTPTANSYAANKKYVDDALDNYATMVRTATEQTIADPKHFVNYIDGASVGKVVGVASGSLVASRSGYVELATINLANNRGVRFLVFGGANNANYCEAEYTLIRGTGAANLRCTYKVFSSANVKPDLWIYDDNGVVHIYGIRLQYAFQEIVALCYLNTGTLQSLPSAELVLTANPGVEVTLPVGAVQETYLQRDSI